MTLERTLLISFEQGTKDSYEIVVPQGAILQDLKIFHDGIYAFYLYPTIRLDGANKVEKFTIVRLGENIPNGATLFRILDTIVEKGDGMQGIAVYPVFKIEE